MIKKYNAMVLFLGEKNPPVIKFFKVFSFVISPSYFAITQNTKLQRKSHCRDNLKYHLPSVRLKKPLKICTFILQEGKYDVKHIM